MPIIVPWTFRFDTLGVQYDAVITASFTYRTSRGLRISAQPNLADGADAVPIPFALRPLAPATRQRSVTLTWLVPGLAGSQIYGLWISSTVLGSPPSSYDISFTNLTLDVEGAPS